MILMSSQQRTWVAENIHTGEFVSWTANDNESRVRGSMKRFKTWGLDPKDYQVAMFTLRREVGCEPKTYSKVVGHYFVHPDGVHTPYPSSKRLPCATRRTGSK